MEIDARGVREHGTRGASTRAKHTAAYLIASASTDLDLTVGAGELEEPPTHLRAKGCTRCAHAKPPRGIHAGHAGMRG